MPEPTLVGVATPLSPAARTLVAEAAGLRLVDPVDLLPAQRWPADHAGAPEDQQTEALVAALADCEVLLGLPGDSGPGLAAAVRALPGLRWVHGTAAGAGDQARKADLSPAELDRVAITTSAGVHGDTLAEFALFGLLAFHKDLDRLLDIRTEHAWPARWPMTQLAGRRLLIVGMGSIGDAVAVRAAAFGMRVDGVRRHADRPPPPGVRRVHGLDQLADAVAGAQDLVLALPGTPDTEGLISADLLAALAPGGVVVNVGRGSVLDEAALASALRSGHLRGAVLDVAATEPRPAEDPLWDLPTVLQSPHTAALSEQEDERIVELFLDNLRRYQAGEALRNQVQPGQWY